MTPQKQPRTDADNRRTPRTKQNDDMEFLVAACEAETVCVGWLLDLRPQTHGQVS